jgi:integrase
MRHVAIPNRITTELKDHLGQFGESDLSGLIFTGEQGQPLRRSNFNKIVKWKDAVVTVGLPVGFRFHDLRHTGTTLAAETGASTRELMERMGHDSSHAALIYQHGSARRDRAIADALDALIDEERTGENDDREEPTSM